MGVRGKVGTSAGGVGGGGLVGKSYTPHSPPVILEVGGDPTGGGGPTMSSTLSNSTEPDDRWPPKWMRQAAWGITFTVITAGGMKALVERHVEASWESADEQDIVVMPLEESSTGDDGVL